METKEKFSLPHSSSTRNEAVKLQRIQLQSNRREHDTEVCCKLQASSES